MDQPPLDFNVPPFQGKTPQTRHTSLSGALTARFRASSQAMRMMARYLTYGLQTDGEQAEALGLPEGRISARRSQLMAKGWVEYYMIVQGPHGAEVTLWMLTPAGQAVAEKLASGGR